MTEEEFKQKLEEQKKEFEESNRNLQEQINILKQEQINILKKDSDKVDDKITIKRFNQNTKQQSNKGCVKSGCIIFILIVVVFTTVILFAYIIATVSIKSDTVKTNRYKNTAERNRHNLIRSMNQRAEFSNVKSSWEMDSVDSTILIYSREAGIYAKDFAVVEETFLAYGKSHRELVRAGFKEMKVYTSEDNYRTYKLVSLTGSEIADETRRQKEELERSYEELKKVTEELKREGKL